MPNEILGLIEVYLNRNDVASAAASCRTLFAKLRLSILKFNIKYQNNNLLHLAAQDNNYDLVQSLLGHGANINAFFHGQTPLMRAIKYSSSESSKLLLEGQDLKAHLKNGRQEDALWYAVKYGTQVIVGKILQRPGFNLNAQDKSGRTVLHLAVFGGRVGIAHLLLSRGADPNIKDQSGHSPKEWALSANQELMVKILSRLIRPSALGRGPFNCDDPPLHQAMAHGSFGAVKQLLKSGNLDLERQDRNGDSPLHLAVRMNSLELVHLLLGHTRINPNTPNRDGNTPIWVSSRLQNDEMTRLFLKHQGVDINFIGGRGKYQTPSSSLHHAVLRLDTSILQTWLETPGVNPNNTAGGQSPLQLAVELGRNDALRMLLNFPGIEINARGGNPPLCQAVTKGALEAVRLLVEQGDQLRVNERTCMVDDTALCIAARDGNVGIVRALSQHRHLNPNLENHHLEHPLFLAARKGDMQVVNALLEDGRLSTRSMKDAVTWTGKGLVRSTIQNHIDWQNRFGEPPE